MPIPDPNTDPQVHRETIDGIPGPLVRKVKSCGFYVAPSFDKIDDALTYKPRDDDLFIITYPKNGTTWTQQIVTCILNGGQIPEGKKVFDLSIFLEMRGKEDAENMPRPGAVKTHLPYHLQPKNGTAKYIVVFRNAKDACVSFHYHHQMAPNYGNQGMDFHDFFKFFIKGALECGSYFDWVKSWWEQRNNPNVLILLYEDMKSDTKSSVLKIAEFIDPKYREELLANDGEILQKVIENSSFQKMKKVINQDRREAHPERPPKFDKNGERVEFIRKGVIGDCVNHFTDDENEIMDCLFHEKFDGTGLEHLWDKYNIFK